MYVLVCTAVQSGDVGFGCTYLQAASVLLVWLRWETDVCHLHSVLMTPAYCHLSLDHAGMRQLPVCLPGGRRPQHLMGSLSGSHHCEVKNLLEIKVIIFKIFTSQTQITYHNGRCTERIMASRLTKA